MHIIINQYVIIPMLNTDTFPGREQTLVTKHTAKCSAEDCSFRESQNAKWNALDHWMGV